MRKFVLLAVFVLFSGCATEFTGGPMIYQQAISKGFEVGDFIVVEGFRNYAINCWLLLDVYIKTELGENGLDLIWASRKHDKTLYRLRARARGPIEWAKARIVSRVSRDGTDIVLKIPDKVYDYIHDPFSQCSILK